MPSPPRIWSFHFRRSSASSPASIGRGRADVVYTSGNQGKPTRPNQPEGFSQAGLVEGSEQEWLESFFA